MVPPPISLRARYAMSGTPIAYGAPIAYSVTALRARYAMSAPCYAKSGTDLGRRLYQLMEQLRDDSEPPLMALPAKKNTTTHDARSCPLPAYARAMRIGATDLEEQLQKKMMTKHDTSQFVPGMPGMRGMVLPASQVDDRHRGCDREVSSFCSYAYVCIWGYSQAVLANCAGTNLRLCPDTYSIYPRWYCIAAVLLRVAQ
eukprot:2111855-Rhodomonas_salina.8